MLHGTSCVAPYLPWVFGFDASPTYPALHGPSQGPVWPMHHIGGLCMCRADQWLTIGLHTIQWTTEAWLAVAGHTSHGVGCGLA